MRVGCPNPVVEPVVESMDFDLPDEDAESKFSVARVVPDLCVYKSNVFFTHIYHGYYRRRRFLKLSAVPKMGYLL